MKRIGIIGFGTMGEAIVRGLQAKDASITAAVIEKSKERRQVAASIDGVDDLSDHPEDLPGLADIIVLSVKPQDLEEIADKLGHVLAGNSIISILAGTSIQTLSARFPGADFVRFMPNLAASIGEAAVGVAIPEDTEAAFREDAFTVARAIGEPFELPERLLAAFTGVSGSGIAYVMSFIHALALGGTRAGMTYEQSLEIARKVVDGACSLLQTTGENPQLLLSRVISPAGTTIDGIRTLENGKFTATVMDAVTAAAHRAGELES